MPDTLLLLHVSQRTAALSTGEVERIAPMAELLVTPGLPSALEGLLNLGGELVPVLRLDRLFGLTPPQQPGLRSMLLVLRGRKAAILADGVSEILRVEDGDFLAMSSADSFNGCAESAVQVRGEAVPVLAPARLLVEKEKQALAGFQQSVEQRWQAWT
jgi:purine-binding chemotaxis protein CheW